MITFCSNNELSKILFLFFLNPLFFLSFYCLLPKRFRNLLTTDTNLTNNVLTNNDLTINNVLTTNNVLITNVLTTNNDLTTDTSLTTNSVLLLSNLFNNKPYYSHWNLTILALTGTKQDWELERYLIGICACLKA